MDWPTIIGIVGGIATAAATGAGVVWRYFVKQAAADRAEIKRLNDLRTAESTASTATLMALLAREERRNAAVVEVVRQATLTAESRR